MFFQLHADLAFPRIRLPSVLAWCGGHPAGSIIALLFMTGLVVGFAHCGPMCGPFVMAQTAGDPHPPGWSRSNAACSFPTTSGAP
jgi:hypothetical protein